MIYKGNLQINRKPVNGQAQYGYRVSAASFKEEIIGSTNIYDGQYHHFVIESLFVRTGTSYLISRSTACILCTLSILLR